MQKLPKETKNNTFFESTNPKQLHSFRNLLHAVYLLVPRPMREAMRALHCGYFLKWLKQVEEVKPQQKRQRQNALFLL